MNSIESSYWLACRLVWQLVDMNQAKNPKQNYRVESTKLEEENELRKSVSGQPWGPCVGNRRKKWAVLSSLGQNFKSFELYLSLVLSAWYGNYLQSSYLKFSIWREKKKNNFKGILHTIQSSRNLVTVE